MIIRQLICALSIMVAVGTVFAGEARIDFPGGNIRPGVKMSISLEQLAPEKAYRFSCMLTSDHAAGKAYHLIQITTPVKYYGLKVDAEETSPGSDQYKLPTNKSSYVYGYIFKSVGSIFITNLDESDSMLISRCSAVEHVFGPRPAR